jgi:type I restriction enzyme S subunit
MSFPRYESYKESGVEWLGEVPEHWEVISIKWLSPVQRGASPRPIDDPKYFDEDGEYAWVRIADVSASDGVLRETTQKLSVLGSSLSVKIAPGELFVSIAGTVGKPCISEIKACIHDGFVYFPRLKINPKLLYRIFESETCYGGLGKWGTQLNLNTDTIGSIRVALPPQKELSLVLSFLDRETAKIDALIAEQQRLIELLKEKRQSVISHAVTKGLSPNAPMKDSGIEWLGEVPEHWEIQKFSRCAFFQEGPGLRNWQFTQDGIRVICVTNITEFGVNFSSYEKFISIDEYQTIYKHFTVSKGDLLLSSSGNSWGKVAEFESDEIAILNTSTIRVNEISSRLIIRSYIKWLLVSGGTREQLGQFMTGSCQPNFGPTHLSRLFVAFPPSDEQQTITAFLDSETAKLDTLTAEAKTAITLLQERRTALISAAVTGKIDVRGLVSAKTEVKAETVPC